MLEWLNEIFKNLNKVNKIFYTYLINNYKSLPSIELNKIKAASLVFRFNLKKKNNELQYLFNNYRQHFIIKIGKNSFNVKDMIKVFIKSCVFHQKSFSVLSISNRDFFKEGFYFDSLQKKSLNTWIKNLFIISTQFYNLNFFNYNFIRFFIDSLFKNIIVFFNFNNNFNIESILKFLFLTSFFIIQLFIIL